MILNAVEKAVIKAHDLARGARWRRRRSARQGRFLGHAAHPYDPRVLEEVYLDPDSSMYIIGESGAGKTKLIEGLIQEDSEGGQGFAVLDFHGDLTQHVLCYLAHRATEEGFRRDLGQGRLTVIKPSDPEWAVGFNPLATGGEASAYGVALELLTIVRRVWGTEVFGPRSEELMRNLFLALAEAGQTLDVAGLFLTQASFRAAVVERITNPEVKSYWETRYDPLSRGMQAAYREAVLNKFTGFLADPHIRAMVGQPKSRVDLRRVMDDSGWLLIDLSKGQLKTNAYLLGGFFLAKLKEAAFSRGNLPEEARRVFRLYVDEFQNVAGETFVEVPTEARKYRLQLRLAHQHLDQLDRELRTAIIGNIGAILAFRMSHHDAALLAPEFDPREARLWERRLTELHVGEAVYKRKGQKPRVVKIRRIVTPPIAAAETDAIKTLSFRQHARPKAEVLREIEQRREAWYAISQTQEEHEEGADRDDDGREGQTGW